MIEQTMNPFENKDVAERNLDEQWIAFCKFYFKFDHLEANLAKQLYFKEVKENAPISISFSGTILTAAIILAVFTSPLNFFILPTFFLTFAGLFQTYSIDRCKKAVENSKEIFKSDLTKELFFFRLIKKLKG